MKRKLFLLLPALVVMIAMSLTSCSDNSDVIGNANNELVTSLEGNWYGEYSLEGETTAGTASIAGTYTKAVQGLQFNADGTGTCTQVLCNIASEPLSIYGGMMDQNNGRFHYTSAADGTVTITRDGEGDKSNPKTWTMKLADGVLSGMDGTTSYQLKTAEDYQLSYLSQWEETLRSGGNSDKNTRSFLTDWPRCEKVFINGIAEPQYLPWAANNPAKSDIPEHLLEEINPSDGWEMAFCALSDPSAEKTRYFGLYNRYRGILRVFMYIPDAQAYGNEMAFEISAGIHGKNRFPLFHAMDYAIPNDRPYSDWDTKVQLITGTSKYSPFSWRQTPYTDKIEATGVSTYWHCFDIDMSGYSPNANEKPWRNSVEDNQQLLSITPISQNTSQVKLTGSLIGDLEGEFGIENPKSYPANPDTHRASIWCKALGGLFGAVPTLGNACLTIGSPERGLGPEFGWVAFIGGIAANIVNTSGAICQGYDKSVTPDEIPGSMNLKLNANLDLSGVMKSWKSLSDGGLRITPAILKKTNPNCHIGKGCVGVESAPVIYISKEDLLSASNNVSLVPEDDGYNTLGLEEDLRFVSFLDPTSVKVNINKSLYTDIKDVNVTAFCSIDAKSPTGHSDSYRNAMKMAPRPTISLGREDVIELNTTTSAIKLHTINRDDLLEDDPVSYPQKDNQGNDVDQKIKDLAKPKLITQVGDEIYRFYGSSMELFGAHWIIDPQAYLPYKNDFFKVPVVPDFIVTVSVKFKCKEQKEVTIIKQFVPEIKIITHDELKAKRDVLKDYYNKSQKGEAVGTVANDASIKVYSIDGYKFIHKSLKMLNAIADKKY